MKLKIAARVCGLTCLALLTGAVLLTVSSDRTAARNSALVTTPEPSVMSLPSQGELTDINTAGPEELEELPGIGPVLAGKIIDYRDEHGPFESIDQLMDVSGIGPATFEKLKDKVTIR